MGRSRSETPKWSGVFFLAASQRCSTPASDLPTYNFDRCQTAGALTEVDRPAQLLVPAVASWMEWVDCCDNQEHGCAPRKHSVCTAIHVGNCLCRRVVATWLSLVPARAAGRGLMSLP